MIIWFQWSNKLYMHSIWYKLELFTCCLVAILFCFHGNGRQQTSEITFFCNAETIIYLLVWKTTSYSWKIKKSICTVVSGLNEKSKFAAAWMYSTGLQWKKVLLNHMRLTIMALCICQISNWPMRSMKCPGNWEVWGTTDCLNLLVYTMEKIWSSLGEPFLVTAYGRRSYAGYNAKSW